MPATYKIGYIKTGFTDKDTVWDIQNLKLRTRTLYLKGLA